MAYAVSLLLDASAGALVSERWQQLADAGLSRSMLDLGYPPHVTLAVYDDLDVNTATTALDGTLTTAPRIDVKLSGITSFGAGSGVVYAALAPSSDLSVLHETVLGTIGGLCRPHYQVGQWTPHCTLATGLPDADVDRAVALLTRDWQPLTGRLESADFVEFLPVVGIRRWPLRG
jgi:2'-5' RNA ligase